MKSTSSYSNFKQNIDWIAHLTWRISRWCEQAIIKKDFFFLPNFVIYSVAWMTMFVCQFYKCFDRLQLVVNKESYFAKITIWDNLCGQYIFLWIERVMSFVEELYFKHMFCLIAFKNTVVVMSQLLSGNSITR